MNLNRLTKTVMGGVLALSILVGCGMTSASSAQAAVRDDHSRYGDRFERRDHNDRFSRRDVRKDWFRGRVVFGRVGHFDNGCDR